MIQTLEVVPKILSLEETKIVSYQFSKAPTTNQDKRQQKKALWSGDYQPETQSLHCVSNFSLRAGKMAKQVKVPAPKTDNLSSVPELTPHLVL